MGGTDITVGGFTPLSSCDWPGELVATVFCQGCPLACRYCHNVDLIPPGPGAGPDWREVLSLLEKRRNLLDGVVFSGGEPTLQRALPQAVAAVRALGFRVGLHTAGPYPERLARLMPAIDWIGFDVKAPFCDYPRITQAPDKHNGSGIRRALSFVLASGKPHEVRCTVDEGELGTDDAERMARQIAEMGVNRLVLQPRRDASGRSKPISEAFVGAMKAWIPNLELRSA